MSGKSVMVIASQVIMLLLLGAVLVMTVVLYRQPVDTQYLIVKEDCGERITFFKILILKPDLNYDLAKKIAHVVDEAARDFDRDPDFILSIISIESRFNPQAISTVGAQGLMQVMPLWLKVMGAEGEDLFDPRINIRKGLQVYNSYEEMLKSKELALTAYNRGSWKVEEDLRVNRDPRNGYAKEVLDVYERLKLMR